MFSPRNASVGVHVTLILNVAGSICCSGERSISGGDTVLIVVMLQIQPKFFNKSILLEMKYDK